MAKLIPVEIGSETEYAIFGRKVAKVVKIGDVGYFELFGWKALIWIGQAKRICGVNL